MCVIYACGTALPPLDELERGFRVNDDGAGLAWLKKNSKGEEMVFWKKDFKNDKELLAYVEAEKIPFPLVIHFRTASVGGKTPELAHPFPVWTGVPTWLEGQATSVLFHNGHLSKWEDMVVAAAMGAREQVPLGPWSDTRALAWLAHLKGPGIIPFLSDTSRVLIFSSIPNTEEGAKYMRSDDHFSYWGKWVYPKDGEAYRGYFQSIDTWPKVTGSVHQYRWSTEADFDDEMPYVHASAEPTPSALSLVPVTVTQKEEPKGNSSTAVWWTLDELVATLNQLEKEQADAKVAAGV